MLLDWVLLRVAAEASGYTVNALRMKIRRGQLIEEIHWRKAQDGRVLINLPNFLAWLKQ